MYRPRLASDVRFRLLLVIHTSTSSPLRLSLPLARPAPPPARSPAAASLARPAHAAIVDARHDARDANAETGVLRRLRFQHAGVDGASVDRERVDRETRKFDVAVPTGNLNLVANARCFFVVRA